MHLSQKNGVFASNYFICFSLRTCSKGLFDVLTTKMPIFVLFVSTGVLFDGVFSLLVSFPLDTGRKLNVHKTFRRGPGRFLNALCTLNLRSVSRGLMLTKMKRKS